MMVRFRYTYPIKTKHHNQTVGDTPCKVLSVKLQNVFAASNKTLRSPKKIAKIVTSVTNAGTVTKTQSNLPKKKP